MNHGNKKQVRVGMVGYKFMGKVHSHAYRDVPFYFEPEAVPVLQAIAGRSEAELRQTAAKLGWLSCETDWRRLIERDDIDLIDIVAPNHLHAEIAIAAAEGGKHILCEKPLAMTLEQAYRMRDAAKKSGVVHMLSHNYRFAPAVQYAKQLIASGRLGRIYHLRATYLQDWLIDPRYPMEWRLRKELTGSGVLGDIGSHIIDLARFLVGGISEVVGRMDTIVKRRPLPGQPVSVKPDAIVMGDVTVDDACSFLATFENGATGVFEATRFAGGNRVGNRFEINGEKGSVRWDMENMNHLQVYFTDDEPGLQGFRTILCTEEQHPFAGNYWPSGHIIGYEHTFINLVSELMNGIARGNSPQPNFDDGVANQEVLAAVEKSVMTKKWETVGK